ncbi:hypothetical protein SFD26_003996 [Salmonella enterica subsp. enterica serovar Infantis]|nr:hypothetical protein [Salmonella enterica subsp. enterica serovar Infantis]EMB9503523.1 hypothetical protein [Salmonella enterica subsp. enterica serovar Infantis]EMC5846720.1 hypothetical protein [Salmonella enterica subsp. enterica serovar Infantis]EMC9315621.1 hypothetical protein [Salmonella enterica subsp. enterica serovar Infantis]
MNRTNLVIDAWTYIALVFAGCGAIFWTVFNPEYINTGIVFIAGTITAWYQAFKAVKKLKQIRNENL